MESQAGWWCTGWETVVDEFLGLIAKMSFRPKIESIERGPWTTLQTYAIVRPRQSTGLAQGRRMYLVDKRGAFVV